MIEIKHNITGEVLKTVEADTLQHANLQGADLQGANLRYADLQGANLQYTNLQYTNLQYTNLQGANLRKTEVKVWQLYRRQWILTSTHIYAGCIRRERPESAENQVWKELTEDETAEANAVLAVMLTLKQ